MLCLRLKRSVIALYLAVIGASAQAEPLDERFYVPSRFHIELERPWPQIVEGLTTTTIEDVVALHSSLSADAVSEERVKSFEFLKNAKITLLGDSPLPPLSPTAGPVDISGWHRAVIDGNLNDLRQETFSAGGSRLIVRTAGSDFEMSTAPGARPTVAVHAPGTLKELWLTPSLLCSRSTVLLKRHWNNYGSNKFSAASPLGVQYVVVSESSDYILVNAHQSRDKEIKQFNLYLWPTQHTRPKPHQRPTLTLMFFRQTRTTPEERPSWKMLCWLINTMQFDAEIDELKINRQ